MDFTPKNPDYEKAVRESFVRQRVMGAFGATLESLLGIGGENGGVPLAHRGVGEVQAVGVPVMRGGHAGILPAARAARTRPPAVQSCGAHRWRVTTIRTGAHNGQLPLTALSCVFATSSRELHEFVEHVVRCPP